MVHELEKRIGRAFGAMRSLGLSVETIKPVLKKLLKLYNWNWELIEEDNYRTLADAIFESVDDKPKAERKDITIKNDIEPPSKKSRIGPPKDQPLSTLKHIRSTTNSEGNESIRDKGKSLVQDRAHAYKNSFVEQASGAHNANRTPTPRAPDLNSMKRDAMRAHETNNTVEPREKQPVDYPLKYSGTAPDTSEGPIEPLQHPKEEKIKNGSGSSSGHRSNSWATCHIASSSCGHARLSLKCDRVKESHYFRSPNSDELLRFVESKYKKSYETIGPKVSLEKLLSEICDSYLEIGADYPNGDQKNKLSGHEPVETDHPRRDKGKMSSCSSNHSLRQRSLDHHSNKRVVCKVRDITKGTENINISLIGEIGSDDPRNFFYIPENTIYQSAYVHMSLARIADEDCCSGCTGNCLSSSIPCACAGDTGGEFAYTPEGLLNLKFLRSCISMNQKPEKHHLFYCQDCPLERGKNAMRPETCKGHLLRKFIKECWRKCGCKMECGNRVVQRGITRNLQVFLTSKGKGWGVRALEELPEGAFVCEYAGEILTNIELYERNKQSNGKGKHVYPVLLDADWATEGVLKDEDALCLDATYYGNVARFINHRCFDSNLLEIPVQVETPDRHYYHLAFFTKRKIDAHEELTWDYGIDFDDHNHPIKAFQCLCGSEYCRGRKNRKK